MVARLCFTITNGASPDSEHTAKALKDGKKLLKDGQYGMIREFISQGAISLNYGEIRKTRDKNRYKITPPHVKLDGKK